MNQTATPTEHEAVLFREGQDGQEHREPKIDPSPLPNADPEQRDPPENPGVQYSLDF